MSKDRPQLQKLLGARIYELRTRAGYTQARIAEIAGISNDTISRIERGQRSPSFKVLERIAHALDTDVHELFNFGNKALTDSKFPIGMIDLFNFFKDKDPEDIRMILKISRTLFDNE